jgi:hypothetical protein
MAAALLLATHAAVACPPKGIEAMVTRSACLRGVGASVENWLLDHVATKPVLGLPGLDAEIAASALAMLASEVGAPREAASPK